MTNATVTAPVAESSAAAIEPRAVYVTGYDPQVFPTVVPMSVAALAPQLYVGGDLDTVPYRPPVSARRGWRVANSPPVIAVPTSATASVITAVPSVGISVASMNTVFAQAEVVAPAPQVSINYAVSPPVATGGAESPSTGFGEYRNPYTVDTAASAIADTEPPTAMITTVSFDAVGTGAATGSGTSLSWSHTASGTQRIVFVVVNVCNGATGAITASATYGGQAMTQLAYKGVNGQDTIAGTFLFVLTNPPTGTSTVETSVSGNSVSGVAANSASFSKAASYGTVSIASGSSNPSMSRTANQGEMIVNALGWSNSNGVTSALTGYSKTSAFTIGAGSYKAAAFCGYSDGTGSSQTFSGTESNWWSGMTVVLTPS